MKRIKIISLISVLLLSFLVVGNVRAVEYDTHTAIEQPNKLGEGGFFTWQGSVNAATKGTSPQVAVGQLSVKGATIKSVDGEDIVFTMHPATGYVVYEIAVNGKKVIPTRNSDGTYTYTMTAADILERNTHELTAEEAAALNEQLVGGEQVSEGDILGAYFCPKFAKEGDPTNPATGDGTITVALVGLAAASLGTIIFVSNKKQTI